MAIDCVVIGDSIAVGVFSTGICVEERASANLTSSRIIDLAPGVWHKYCIISAGANDDANGNVNPKLLDNLNHIRNQTTCQYYLWIEPANSAAAQQAVITAARARNDYTVTYTASSDGVHPSSYSPLAATITTTLGY